MRQRGRFGLIWINLVERQAVDQYLRLAPGWLLMGALDLQIGWLHKHKACAEDALRDLKRGRKIEINDKDVTQEWVATYEHIIAKYREPIFACKARNH